MRRVENLTLSGSSRLCHLLVCVVLTIGWIRRVSIQICDPCWVQLWKRRCRETKVSFGVISGSRFFVQGTGPFGAPWVFRCSQMRAHAGPRLPVPNWV